MLAAGSDASAWARPLGTELFRSQSELNHAVVDALEDLPWLCGWPGARAELERRLLRWLRFSSRPPRRAGARGKAVFLVKSAALLAAERTHAELLLSLTRSNRWALALLDALATGAPLPGHAPTLPQQASALEPWVSAQRRFWSALAACAARHREPLCSRAAAVRTLAAPLAPGPVPPGVSVLVVGSGAVSGTEGALEVLFAGAPREGLAGARTGDAADAKGEVLVRVPAGEALLPGGLAALARPFEDPGLELVFADALLPDGQPVLRPGWSPEALWEWPCVGGVFAMRLSTVRRHQLSRDRPALEWLLRPGFAERQVHRVPGFASRGPQPPGTVADLAVVEADLQRRGARGVVKIRGARREVRLEPAQGTKVSVVVPFKDRPELLEGLWASLRRFEAGVDWELILANNGSTQRRTARFLASLGDARVQVFDWNHPFNYSAINNAAARLARAPLLLFLNNDVAARHDGWMANLAGHALLPEVGVAGARLLYADGSVQHAGVAIGLKGLAGHVFARWRPEFGPTPFGPPDATRNWSAVTGACLMIRSELFRELGGFDESLRISGGDVALCLAARRRGLRVVCVGGCELWHYESQSRGRDPVPRLDVLREAEIYRDLLESGDPYYHPLLSTEAAHGGPGVLLETPRAHARRVMEPWIQPSGLTGA